MRIELLACPAGYGALEREWRTLAAGSDCTPFQTWEWQSCWLKRFGGAAHLLTVREGADLIALYPLCAYSGPWRSLRPAGIGPSDYLEPLARRGLEQPAAEAIASWLNAQRDQLIDLQQLRESAPLAQLLSAVTAPITQATCLSLTLPNSFEAYTKTLSKGLRYDIRRIEPLLASGHARIQLHTAGDVQEGIDILFALHSARWRRRGLPGAFFGRRAWFQRDWAQLAAERGWLKLTTLWRGGAPIGALYVMELGSSAYFYQSGFAAQPKLSPGTILVADAIRRATDSGLTRFDFLRGDEPYKRRWQPETVQRNLRFLLPRGRMPQLGARWNNWGAGVEARIRAKLEG